MTAAAASMPNTFGASAPIISPTTTDMPPYRTAPASQVNHR